MNGIFIALTLVVLCYHHHVYSTRTLNQERGSIGNTYDTKFDDIDINDILKQDRLLTNYIKCLEYTGPCTSDAKLLRDILPDAISSNCSKCTYAQMNGSMRVTHFLIDNRPADWIRLEKKFNPSGTYRKKYIIDKNKLIQKQNKTQ